MEQIKYYLVLEKRLGDYNLIDINKLDLCKYPIGNDIASIDGFTCRFTETEIKESILRANIAHDDYFNGNLKIISDAKHNFKVLTKEVFNCISEFQNDNEEIDREFKNKLYGSYKKVVERAFEDVDFIKGMLDRFKEILKNGNKYQIFSVIEELPYDKSRTIYFGIYDELHKRKIEKIKKLEKLNDAA